MSETERERKERRRNSKTRKKMADVVTRYISRPANLKEKILWYM